MPPPRAGGTIAPVPLPGRRRKERSARERLGHEEPGAVLRGPPITLSCECGEKAEVAYGEIWRCPADGRTYDTNKIPRDAYTRIRRTQFRFRILPIVYSIVFSAAAVFFITTGNAFSVFLLLPVAVMGWFLLIRPIHRSRYRSAIADLPKWDLRAD